MKIIQIVGFKNSGKTSLSTELIRSLVSNGFRTASLKHHGHGGEPLGLENTDSYKQQQAGAIVAGVEGSGMFQLKHVNGWNIEQLIAIYRLFNIDVLVIEGFKYENYPKIVLIKNKEELSLLKQLTNIIAVVSAVSMEESSISFPVFSYDQIEKLCHYYIEHYVVN